jgi:plastocyanin
MLSLTLFKRSLLALLVLASAALSTAAPPTASAEDGPSTVYEVRASRLLFDKSSLTVFTGSTVTVRLINEDYSIPHNLGVDILGVHPTEVCAGPCEATLVFTAPGPGNYQFFCTLHQGMQGELYVVAP